METTVTTRPEGHNPQASQEFAEGAGCSQTRHGRTMEPVDRCGFVSSTKTTDDGLFCKEVTNLMAEIEECDEANAHLYAVTLMIKFEGRN